MTPARAGVVLRRLTSQGVHEPEEPRPPGLRHGPQTTRHAFGRLEGILPELYLPARLARGRQQRAGPRRGDGQARPIPGGAQKITLKTARKPAFAGVDPYNFYVDRNSDDNVRAVDES